VFKCAADRGLSNLLAAGLDSVPLDELIAETGVENLSFLPTGPIPPNPVEILDSARFGQVLDELLRRFELVIFDAPPSLNLVDALVIGKRVDGLVLVVRTFVTPKLAAQQIFKHLVASRVRMLGVILNNVDMPSGGYYYNYSSYYYYSYSRYGYYQQDEPTGGRRPKGSRRRSFILAVRRLLGGGAPSA
jgi:capsular exopolysaccharide synthesis family protein